MPSKKNISLVAEVTEQLRQAQSVVISDYRGLSVFEITALRAKMRPKGVMVRVIKNRLAKIALTEAGLPIPEKHLKGPSAFTFSMNDAVSGPKTLTEFMKDNEKVQIKCGLFEGAILDVNGVKALADMPSREELLGRLLADLKSPAAKFAIVLKATVNKLGYALKAVAEKKEKEAAA